MGQRFCNACGEVLQSTAGKVSTPDHLAEKVRAGSAVMEGERKHVTVLFADVMGSMELAEQCDPEEWRQAGAGVGDLPQDRRP